MIKRAGFLILLSFLCYYAEAKGDWFSGKSMQLEQAQAYERDGNDAQAETIYKQIITGNPDGNEALMAQEKLVLLYFGKGMESEAKTSFLKMTTDFCINKKMWEAVIETVYFVADRCDTPAKYEMAKELFQHVMSQGGQSAIWCQQGIENKAYLS